jgi:hypothetical protein
MEQGQVYQENIVCSLNEEAVEIFSNLIALPDNLQVMN